MGNIINFDSLRLSKEEVEKMTSMHEECQSQEVFEFKKVSGLEVVSCPFCKNNGCYGACSIGR